MKRKPATRRSMARFRLSVRAAADMDGIADYTILKFGIQQARRYRDGLENAFQMLAEDRLRSRTAEELTPHLRRANYESHVIFFMRDKAGIFIVRILHQRMEFERHTITGD